MKTLAYSFAVIGYISHAVAEAGDLRKVILDAGTSEQKAHAHYRELVTKEDGEAWFASTPEVCGVEVA